MSCFMHQENIKTCAILPIHGDFHCASYLVCNQYRENFNVLCVDRFYFISLFIGLGFAFVFNIISNNLIRVYKAITKKKKRSGYVLSQIFYRLSFLY